MDPYTDMYMEEMYMDVYMNMYMEWYLDMFKDLYVHTITCSPPLWLYVMQTKALFCFLPPNAILHPALGGIIHHPEHPLLAFRFAILHAPTDMTFCEHITCVLYDEGLGISA